MSHLLTLMAPQRFPNPRDLFGPDDLQAIRSAIRAAEEHTSGEIRVMVIGPCRGNVLRRAQREFARLRMKETRERTGVLILWSVWRRRFAIWADEGIHGKCLPETWMELAREMGGAFRDGQFTTGIVGIVGKVGRLLAEHFPRRPDDVNELSDTVIFG